MIVKRTTFITSAVKPNQYPLSDLPEIAFAGRSNVGKSSLINVLVNRKNLVRTSSTPGRTQCINFFQVNEAVSLVDLPGYGFAKVPLAVKRQWAPMIETYLSQRDNLCAVVLLMDIRRTPGTEDLQMLHWLRTYSVPALVVATKCDKVTRNERARLSQSLARSLGLPAEELCYFSALTREGKDGVWQRLDALLPAGGSPKELVEEDRDAQDTP